MRKLFCAVILFALFFMACEQPVSGDPDYVGNWYWGDSSHWARYYLSESSFIGENGTVGSTDIDFKSRGSLSVNGNQLTLTTIDTYNLQTDLWVAAPSQMVQVLTYSVSGNNLYLTPTSGPSAGTTYTFTKF